MNISKLSKTNIVPVKYQGNVPIEKVNEIIDVINNESLFINVTYPKLVLTKEQNGCTILLNTAAGSDVILPPSEIGLTYKFKILTKVTSNDYSINTFSAKDLLLGGVQLHSTSTLDKVTQFSPDGSDDDVMSMNGTTTGGDVASSFIITCISTERWYIEGIVTGTGVFTTPFL